MFSLRFILFAIIIIVSFGIVFYVKMAPLPVYDISTPSTTLLSPVAVASVNEGKRMALTICSRCHYNDELRTLAGKKHGNPGRLGDFWSSNITQDTLTGIGSWTDSELYFFLRTGVKKNGEFALDMPKYPNLSERDLMSIIAFLKSDDVLVRPTKHEVPKPEYSFITKSLLLFWLKPIAFRNVPVEHPDTSDLLRYGKYLATAKYSCFDCHSGNMATNDYLHPEKSWRFFEGGNPHANEQGEKVYSLNLTPDKESGTGSWTEEQFIRAVKYGIKPDGEIVKDPMFPFTLLSDYEIKAIFQYLLSLKPVKNDY